MKLKYDKLLSNFAFKCNLRHYTMEVAERRGAAAATAARDDAAEALASAERRWATAVDGSKDASAEALSASERRLTAASSHTSQRVGDLEERVVAGP